MMKKFFSNKYYLFAARIVLAFIFIYAGTEKISDPEAFAISISNYRLFPISLINLFAIVLPWIEIVSGILLLFGIAAKDNSKIITTMLIVFTFAIIISLFRGLDIDCGCFGKGTQIGIKKLAENILMIIAGLSLVAFGSDYLKLKSDS